MKYRLQEFFLSIIRWRMSPDVYGTIALLMMVITPFVAWKVYNVASYGEMHGGYLWLVVGFIWLLYRCTRIGWRGDSARRSAFAVEPVVLQVQDLYL